MVINSGNKINTLTARREVTESIGGGGEGVINIIRMRGGIN